MHARKIASDAVCVPKLSLEMAWPALMRRTDGIKKVATAAQKGVAGAIDAVTSVVGGDSQPKRPER